VPGRPTRPVTFGLVLGRGGAREGEQGTGGQGNAKHRNLQTSDAHSLSQAMAAFQR